MALIDLPLAAFLDRLASADPTPGGGSAAALGGALAAGLGEMVSALTLGKPKFAAVDAEARAIAGRLGRCRQALQTLIDEDAAAYEALSAAFKTPKAAADRSDRIAQAAALAAAVPLEVVAFARRTRAELSRLATIGNPNLQSDVQAGLALSYAAMQAAAANVRANLPFLAEADASRVRSALQDLLRDSDEVG